MQHCRYENKRELVVKVVTEIQAELERQLEVVDSCQVRHQTGYENSTASIEESEPIVSRHNLLLDQEGVAEWDSKRHNYSKVDGDYRHIRR